MAAFLAEVGVQLVAIPPHAYTGGLLSIGKAVLSPASYDPVREPDACPPKSFSEGSHQFTFVFPLPCAK